MGALVQVLAVLVVFPPLIFAAVRHQREVGIFVVGVFVLMLGIMAVRTVH